MAISVGDIVEYIDDKLKLKVLALRGNQLLVQDDFGLEYEVPLNQVIKRDQNQTDFVLPKAPTFKKEKEFNPGLSITVNNTYQIVAKGIAEVDLHLSALLPDHIEFNDKKALQLQLDAFEFAISRAKKGRLKQLVIIHGYGEGILRQEIRNRLKDKGLEFSDANYQRYGQGASCVYFS